MPTIMAASTTHSNASRADAPLASQTKQQTTDTDLREEDTTASTLSEPRQNKRDSSPLPPVRDATEPLLQEDLAVSPSPGEFDTATVPLHKVPSTKEKAPRRTKGGINYHSAQKWASRHNWWPWELGYWLCSLAFLVAIIVVLAVFDGQKLPKWKFGITVNTLVSVFATINILQLTIIIGAGMGQVKWIWFGRQARPLIDFDMIDEASKGPTGSIVLLLRGRGGFPAITGACLTVLLLAVGPFVQQIIAFEDRPVSQSTASIPIAQNYSPETTPSVDINSLTVDMKAAILNGALSTSALEYQNVPSCATGNCTWGNYQSLAVCSACAAVGATELGMILKLDDVTSLEEAGVFIVYAYWDPFETSAYYAEKKTPTLAFPDHGTLIADVFLLNLFGTFECILEFCVKTYNASVKNGNFIETEIKSTHQRGTTSMIAAYNHFAYGAGYNFPPLNFTDDVGIHTIDPENTFYLSQYINLTFMGSVGDAPDTSNGFEGQVESSSDVVEALYTLMVGGNNPNATPDVIFDNTARSMTKVIRANAHTSDGTAKTLALGQALRNETFISVRWLWLILPAAVQLLALAFLVAIIHLTRRAGLEAYKDGVLPVLFHGIDEESRRNIGRLSLADMAEKAEKTEMVLVDRHSAGWSLSSASIAKNGL